MNYSEGNIHQVLQNNSDLRRQMAIAEDLSWCIRKVGGALTYMLTFPLPFLSHRDYKLGN
ncbi:MAG: hypothetical protein V7731_09165 [Amphritea sp.]